DGPALGRRDHRPNGHATRARARNLGGTQRADPRDDLRRLPHVMGYSLVKIEDVEGEGPGNAVRFVRRRLGCEAFGINWFGVYRIEGELVAVEEGTFLRFD